MTIQLAVDLVKNTLLVALTVIAPLVTVGILVGLTVSLIQSITSIQEQTLTFIPKLVAVAFTAMLIGNWMVVEITDFAIQNFQLISTMAP